MANWKIDQLENVMDLLNYVPKQVEVYQLNAIRANTDLAVHLLSKVFQEESDFQSEQSELLHEVVGRLKEIPALLEAEKMYRVDATCRFVVPLVDQVYRCIQIEMEEAE